MKCPHCNQEHPEGYKFCPQTGKEIIYLKACHNLTCNEYGKHILPMDFLFCPTCGCNLEDHTSISNEESEDNNGNEYHGYKDDLHKFFPVAGITLGESTVEEVKLSSGYITTLDDKTITEISLLHFDPMFPEWKGLGFDWRLSYTEWKDLFLGMGFDIKERKMTFQDIKKQSHKKYSYAKFWATSSDRSIQFELEFYGEIGCDSTSKNTLDSIFVSSRNSSHWEDKRRT